MAQKPGLTSTANEQNMTFKHDPEALMSPLDHGHGKTQIQLSGAEPAIATDETVKTVKGKESPLSSRIGVELHENSTLHSPESRSFTYEDQTKFQIMTELNQQKELAVNHPARKTSHSLKGPALLIKTDPVQAKASVFHFKGNADLSDEFTVNYPKSGAVTQHLKPDGKSSGVFSPRRVSHAN